MPLAQEIYDTLIKDPDLEIGQNQTREQAAKTEAEQRARQYTNNVQALALATEPLKKTNSIKQLFSFINSVIKNKKRAKVMNKPKEDLQKHYTEETPKAVEEKPEQLTETQEKPEVDSTLQADKKNKVLNALFGDNLDSEDAKIYAQNLDENPSELDGAYKRHVIGAIEQKIKDDKKKELNEEKRALKQKDIKQKEETKKLKDEAKLLPYTAKDLTKTADENGYISPIQATKHARELIAHEKKYSNHLTPTTSKKLKEAIEHAIENGADEERIQKEMEEHGDSFGTTKHLSEAHQKDLKDAEYDAKHRRLISGKSPESHKALDDAIHSGQFNRFTEFNDDGTPKHDIHISTDDKGRALSLDESEKTTHKGKEKKKYHTDKGHTLGEHHLLSELDPQQQQLFEELKTAKAQNNTNKYNEVAKQLEDAGIHVDDIHNTNGGKIEQPEIDPEVAGKMAAQGRVAQTTESGRRVWVKRENLQQWKDQHGEHDASIVSGSHKSDGTNAFAVNDDGNVSDSKFLYHGSGKLIPIGDGKKPSGGSINNNQLLGNALHEKLSTGGAIDFHSSNDSGMTTIKNFTDKNSQGDSFLNNIASDKTQKKKAFGFLDDFKGELKQGAKDFMEGFREGSGQTKKKKSDESDESEDKDEKKEYERQLKEARLSRGRTTKGYPQTKSSSLKLLLKKYPNQKKSTIKQTKKV